MNDLIAEQMRRNAAVIEQACEAALQKGECGVFVERLPDGSVRATVHPFVPYGWIYETRIPVDPWDIG